MAYNWKFGINLLLDGFNKLEIIFRVHVELLDLRWSKFVAIHLHLAKNLGGFAGK